MKAYELEYSYMYMRLLGIQVFIIIHVRLVLPINQLNIICHLYSFNQCFKVFVPYFTNFMQTFWFLMTKNDCMREICQIVSTHI